MSHKEWFLAWAWRCAWRGGHKHDLTKRDGIRVVTCKTCGRTRELEPSNRCDFINVLAAALALVVVARDGVVTWQALAIAGISVGAGVASRITDRRRRRERGDR